MYACNFKAFYWETDGNDSFYLEAGVVSFRFGPVHKVDFSCLIFVLSIELNQKQNIKIIGLPNKKEMVHGSVASITMSHLQRYYRERTLKTDYTISHSITTINVYVYKFIQRSHDSTLTVLQILFYRLIVVSSNSRSIQ